MATIAITQINLRPVQEFTGDRMKQAQRMNADVRTGIAQSIHQVRTLTHRTVLASLGLGGLAYDGARRRATDSWEFLDRAEQRGEEIEHNVVTSVSGRVHQLETQASAELRKLHIPVPSAPAVPTVPGKQVINKPLDWTVRRISLRRQENGLSQWPIDGYDALSAQQIVGMTKSLSADSLGKVRAYEASNKARVTVLRTVDMELQKQLAVA